VVVPLAGSGRFPATSDLGICWSPQSPARCIRTASKQRNSISEMMTAAAKCGEVDRRRRRRRCTDVCEKVERSPCPISRKQP
jgi:hypothetical protein